MSNIKRPALEGTVAVRGDRRLSFAEYGSRARPGDRLDARHPGRPASDPARGARVAEEHGLRIIGVDRPGIGSSTPHLYPNILDWARDLEILLDTLGDRHRAADRAVRRRPVRAGRRAWRCPTGCTASACSAGVAPTQGVDAVDGGIIQLAVRLAPLLSLARVPLGIALTQAIRLVRPLAGPGLDLYAAVQPPGDKKLLARPEFKAMFLDDLLNGSRFQTSAPLTDLVLFTRDWGFAAADVSVPVRWWHGDADHIVPFAHGEHMVDRLPDATMSVIDGESHLGGLGIAERGDHHLMDLGPRRTDTPADGAFLRNAVSLVFSGPHLPQWVPQLHTCHLSSTLRSDETAGEGVSRRRRRRGSTVTARTAPAPRRGASSTSTQRRPRCARTSSGPSAACSALP